MVEMKEHKNIEGKVEFDIIVNGECERRVKGLLAYEDVEKDGMAIMGKCSPSFAVKVMIGLMKYLLDSGDNFAILAFMIEVDRLLKDLKEK